MRKFNLLLVLSCLVVSSSIFSQPVPPQKAQGNIELAREGCQKPLGFFPTPAKLQCMLTAFGLSQSDTKPKTMAIIFNVCEGRSLQPPSANNKMKKYPTLAACLQDPAGISNINKELASEGFPAVKIVHPEVLSSPSKEAATTPPR
jgi:hypothetical protein